MASDVTHSVSEQNLMSKLDKKIRKQTSVVSKILNTDFNIPLMIEIVKFCLSGRILSLIYLCFGNLKNSQLCK